MKDRSWYCPAVDREIDEGLCREYCFAGHGGPEETLQELEKWIRLSRRYADIDDFHRICAACVHCQREEK